MAGRLAKTDADQRRKPCQDAVGQAGLGVGLMDRHRQTKREGCEAHAEGSVAAGADDQLRLFAPQDAAGGANRGGKTSDGAEFA
jgi:hypothetical protein